MIGHLTLAKPLPDETLYSLVSRIFKLNDFENAVRCCAALFGDLERPRVADALFDPIHFSLATDGFYGSISELEKMTTTVPYYLCLGTRPTVETPRQFSANDVEASPSTAGLATLSNGRAHLWRWCPQCAQAELADHGVDYWHCTHQLPGVLVCRRHQARLQETNLPFRARQRDFVRPRQLTGAQPRCPFVQDSASTEILFGLAEFAETALRIVDKEHHPETVRGAIIDGLINIGLATRKGVIHRQAFISDFFDHYSVLANVHEFAQYLTLNSIKNLLDALSQPGTMLPATSIVLLAYWLFGTCQLFVAHCLWREQLSSHGHGVDGRSIEDGISSSASVTREKYRTICISFVKEHPDASRSDFWHAHYKACRWLSRYDEEWINVQLPKMAPNSIIQVQQLSLF